MEFSNIGEIREFFAEDQFATKCLGATIDSYNPETGEARVSMTLDDRHHNAQGAVMGGVFFTLGDFALAVATNVGQPPSASINASIAHLRRAKGNRLYAIARPDKKGRSLAFCTIDIYDETDAQVARMTATVMRMQG